MATWGIFSLAKCNNSALLSVFIYICFIYVPFRGTYSLKIEQPAFFIYLILLLYILLLLYLFLCMTFQFSIFWQCVWMWSQFLFPGPLGTVSAVYICQCSWSPYEFKWSCCSLQTIIFYFVLRYWFLEWGIFHRYLFQVLRTQYFLDVMPFIEIKGW